MKYFILFFSTLLPYICYTQTDPGLQDIIDQYHYQDSLAHTSTWPDFSETFLSERLAYLKQAEESLKAIAEDGLSIKDLASKDILELIIEDEIYGLELQSYLFPLNSEGILICQPLGKAGLCIPNI